MTETPDWIDPAASAQLPTLRAAGESQELEFIKAFPENTRELAKEIAAFASSNPGVILIGVSNEGELGGMPEAHNILKRDELIRRIEGICSGSISPAVTPQVSFAAEDDKLVLVLRIPRGAQPIYYCNNVPYIRHLTQSRPAHPDEVVERVSEWLSRRAGGTDPENEFYGGLVSAVREFLLWTDEFEQRAGKPWIDSLKWVLEARAAELRSIAVTKEAVEAGLQDSIEAMADHADAVANHRHCLGRQSWNECKEKVLALRASALEMKGRVIDALNVDPSVRREALEELGRVGRELNGLSRRAEAFSKQGRMSEVQNEAANLGRTLVRLSYWGLDRGPAELVLALRQAGKELHLLETLRMEMGGGDRESVLRAIPTGAETVRSLVQRFSETQS